MSNRNGNFPTWRERSAGSAVEHKVASQRCKFLRNCRRFAMHEDGANPNVQFPAQNDGNAPPARASDRGNQQIPSWAPPSSSPQTLILNPNSQTRSCPCCCLGSIFLFPCFFSRLLLLESSTFVVLYSSNLAGLRD